MQTITVNLGPRSYPIYLGENLLQKTSLFKRHLNSKQVMIISNDTIAPLYLEKLSSSLETYSCDSVVLPDGEHYKTLTTLNQIVESLLLNKHDRTTTLCALGGGVVGDLTGFAAACYRRGVSYIQCPTTLLAQVDAAIGGKTGVNHSLGKNMIGAVYQPRCVIIDIATLKTLPEREFLAGLGEVVKYGLITDADFFEWLENNLDDILQRREASLIKMIGRSCEIKAKIVAEDETEEGIRALLNFGHTFGHAFESATFYKELLHGEAVALGIKLATAFSHKLGWINNSDKERINVLIERIGLPVKPPSSVSVQQLLQFMAFDKKVIARKLRLVLLKDIGKAIVTDKFDKNKLNATLTEFFRE